MRNKKGFTLLEILLAISIFVIMVASLFTLYVHSVDANKFHTDNMDKFEKSVGTLESEKNVLMQGESSVELFQGLNAKKNMEGSKTIGSGENSNTVYKILPKKQIVEEDEEDTGNVKVLLGEAGTGIKIYDIKQNVMKTKVTFDFRASELQGPIKIKSTIYKTEDYEDYLKSKRHDPYHVLNKNELSVVDEQEFDVNVTATEKVFKFDNFNIWKKDAPTLSVSGDNGWDFSGEEDNSYKNAILNDSEYVFRFEFYDNGNLAGLSEVYDPIRKTRYFVLTENDLYVGEIIDNNEMVKQITSKNNITDIFNPQNYFLYYEGINQAEAKVINGDVVYTTGKKFKSVNELANVKDEFSLTLGSDTTGKSPDKLGRGILSGFINTNSTEEGYRVPFSVFSSEEGLFYKHTKGGIDADKYRYTFKSMGEQVKTPGIWSFKDIDSLNTVMRDRIYFGDYGIVYLDNDYYLHLLGATDRTEGYSDGTVEVNSGSVAEGSKKNLFNYQTDEQFSDIAPGLKYNLIKELFRWHIYKKRKVEITSDQFDFLATKGDKIYQVLIDRAPDEQIRTIGRTIESYPNAMYMSLKTEELNTPETKDWNLLSISADPFVVEYFKAPEQKPEYIKDMTHYVLGVNKSNQGKIFEISLEAGEYVVKPSDKYKTFTFSFSDPSKVELKRLGDGNLYIISGKSVLLVPEKDSESSNLVELFKQSDNIVNVVYLN